MPTPPLPTRSVFITGAAAGIGRATALAFAARGFLVGAYDLDEVGLKSLTELVEDAGGRAVTGHLDVTDPEEFTTRLAEFADTAGGQLGVLVNNAGILLAGKFEEVPLDAQLRQIDINAKGVLTGLHAGFAHLGAGSVVVNLASASAIYGQAELATYSATKFFVRALTEALDLEWGAAGIRVIAMWPLFVKSAMTEGISTGTTTSLGIRLTPEQVAADIVAAVEPSWPRRLLHQVHYPVGVPAKALLLGSRFAPAWLTRAVNARLAGS